MTDKRPKRRKPSTYLFEVKRQLTPSPPKKRGWSQQKAYLSFEFCTKKNTRTKLDPNLGLCPKFACFGPEPKEFFQERGWLHFHIWVKLTVLTLPNMYLTLQARFRESKQKHDDRPVVQNFFIFYEKLLFRYLAILRSSKSANHSTILCSSVLLLMHQRNVPQTHWLPP